MSQKKFNYRQFNTCTYGILSPLFKKQILYEMSFIWLRPYWRLLDHYHWGNIQLLKLLQVWRYVHKNLELMITLSVWINCSCLRLLRILWLRDVKWLPRNSLSLSKAIQFFSNSNLSQLLFNYVQICISWSRRFLWRCIIIIVESYGWSLLIIEAHKFSRCQMETSNVHNEQDVMENIFYRSWVLTHP